MARKEVRETGRRGRKERKQKKRKMGGEKVRGREEEMKVSNDYASVKAILGFILFVI